MTHRLIDFVKKWIFAQLVGLIIISLAIYLYPRQLVTSTEIVGFPIHSNFNINRLFFCFYCLAIGLPGISFLIFLGRQGLSWPQFKSKISRWMKPIRSQTQIEKKWTHLFNSFFIGFSFSFCLISSTWGNEHFLEISTISGLIYTLSIEFIFRNKAALVNLCLAPLTVFSLFAVSQFTGVIEKQGVQKLSWLNLTFVVLTVAFLYEWIRKQVKQGGGIQDLETQAVAWICMPVTLFLMIASIPGSLGQMDYFHDGEALASAALQMKGAFPWRDSIFIHGLFNDPWRALIGFQIFFDSRWGFVAGESLILIPLYWVSFYLFLNLFFKRERLFVFCVAWLFPICYYQFSYDFWHLASLAWVRFIPLPFVYLLFYRLLKRRCSTWRAALFAGAAGFQAIVTPESSFVVMALGLTLIGYELYHFKSDRSFYTNFYRTIQTAGWGALFLFIWIFYLEEHGALTGFVQYYLVAKDHRFSGGIPIQRNTVPGIYFEAALPLFLINITFWYLVLSLQKRKVINNQDWLMIGISTFLLFYYQKFVSRADTHVLMPFSMSLPVFFYFLYQVFKYLPKKILLVIFCLFVGIKSPDLIANLKKTPQRFRPVVIDSSETGRMKYSQLNPEDQKALDSLQKFFTEHLPQEESVFDFTNEPALFHYLLDLKPASRFFHVSMALLKKSQQMLIEDLEKSRPKFVIYYHSTFLMHWDNVPNMVRHYDVSQYLLEHYFPAHLVEDFLILERNDSKPAQINETLFGQAEACNWGYVPHFFSPLFLSFKPKNPLPLQFYTRKSRPEEGKTGYVTEIQSPQVPLSQFKFLEIQFSKIGGDHHILAEKPKFLGDARSILFSSLKDVKDSTTYKIQMGSCIQWHGFNSPLLYLTSKEEPHLISIQVMN